MLGIKWRLPKLEGNVESQIERQNRERSSNHRSDKVGKKYARRTGPSAAGGAMAGGGRDEAGEERGLRG